MVRNTVLNDMFSLGRIVDDFLNTAPERTGRSGYPSVDIFEGSDTIEIRASLPGVTSDDLDIELSEKTVTISGEKKEPAGDFDYLRRERIFGKFTRSVELPYRVEAESIKADLKNGVLHLSLAKSEDAKPKKIEIRQEA